MAIVTPIPIPSGPSVPNSNDPETTFDEQFEASLTWQRDELAPKANALAEATFDNATDAQASATAAAASATAAHNAEVAAMSSTNFKGDWAGLSGSLTPPASVAHLGRTWNLLEPIANVTTEQPGVSSKWRAYDVVMPIVKTGGPPPPGGGVWNVNATPHTHVVVDSFLAEMHIHLPDPAQEGDYIVVTTYPAPQTVILDPGAGSVQFVAEPVTLDLPHGTTYSLRYIGSTWRFI